MGVATLAHEMAHVWQQNHRRPPLRRYHDRQWAQKMKDIGLYPSGTGQHLTHYIMPDGRHAKACSNLQAKGFQLRWQSISGGEQAKGEKATKTQFICPECGQHCWAKPDALLVCGICYEDEQGRICQMLPEPHEEEIDGNKA